MLAALKRGMSDLPVGLRMKSASKQTQGRKLCGQWLMWKSWPVKHCRVMHCFGRIWCKRVETHQFLGPLLVSVVYPTNQACTRFLVLHEGRLPHFSAQERDLRGALWWSTRLADADSPAIHDRSFLTEERLDSRIPKNPAVLDCRDTWYKGRAGCVPDV